MNGAAMSEHEYELMERDLAELDPMSGLTPYYGVLLIVLLTGLALGCALERHAEPLKGMIL